MLYLSSSIIIGLSIIVASIILGRHISSLYESNDIGTYQIAKVDNENIVLLDTRTGQYWRKPILDNSSIKRDASKADKYA